MKKIQLLIHFICFGLFIALIFSDNNLRIILGSIVVILFVVNITNKLYEFDVSGECITIRKPLLYKTGYIKPIIEIPKIYLKDYFVTKSFLTYYLTLHVDRGRNEIKK